MTTTKVKRVSEKKLDKQPEIDISEMSYQDAMNLSVFEAKLQRMAILQDRINRGDVTNELLDELLNTISPALIEETYAMFRDQMAKVVKWLPDDWFVPDADPTASLADPDTYKMLRADKAKELRKLIQKAQQSASKNSGGG